MKNNKPLLKSISLGAAILLGFLIYAYAFQVTKVDFSTAQDSKRLSQLARVIRALAHPNVFEYDRVEQHIDYPFYLPCPEDGPPVYEPDTSGPYLVIEPACAGPKEFVQITGFNFSPNSSGPVNFIGQSGAIIQLGNLATDSEGYFTIKAELPNRQPLAEAQTIQAVARVNIGSPHFSDMAITTWDMILETIFLALLATTFGTLIAIPISFFAARNLMSDVKSSLTSAALTIIGWPFGLALGGLVAVLISLLVSSLDIFISIAGVFLSALVAWFAARWALPPEETEPPSKGVKIARKVVLVLAAVIGIFFLNFLAVLFQYIGELIMENLSWVSFVGYLFYQFGDIFKLLSPVLVALGLGGALGGVSSRAGQSFSDRMPAGAVKTLNIIVAAFAGAILFALIGQGINWFYQIEEISNFSSILSLSKTLWMPVGIGALAGIVLALIYPAKKTVPTGMVIYAIMRTILNGLRSIEPLVMAIVFVIWVGIGPFAGALALGLHTIAALGKLYSEQVESISAGPIEAVTATGANRLQTIIYAVVPQIIPPYISFTMYRWDINVRMSTIIGFVGGGGIGFLLQQNIRLLHYRDASVQMIAIAIVVASMDYISSTLRERFV